MRDRKERNLFPYKIFSINLVRKVSEGWSGISLATSLFFHPLISLSLLFSVTLSALAEDLSSYLLVYSNPMQMFITTWRRRRLHAFPPRREKERESVMFLDDDFFHLRAYARIREGGKMHYALRLVFVIEHRIASQQCNWLFGIPHPVKGESTGDSEVCSPSMRARFI